MAEEVHHYHHHEERTYRKAWKNAKGEMQWEVHVESSEPDKGKATMEEVVGEMEAKYGKVVNSDPDEALGY